MAALSASNDRFQEAAIGSYGSIAGIWTCERAPPAYGDAPMRTSAVSELLRLARISIAESRCREQLPMRPDAMQDDRTSTHSINKQEVRSEMTLHKPAQSALRLLSRCSRRADGSFSPPMRSSKTYSRVSTSNSGWWRAFL